MDAIPAARGLYHAGINHHELNAVAVSIVPDLRHGNTELAAYKLWESGADVLGIRDAVLGHANLYRVPWRTDVARDPRRSVAIIEGDRRTRFLDMLEDELVQRGASVERLAAGDLRMDQGRLFERGVERSLPQAVFPTATMTRHTGLLDAMEAGGSFVLNPGRAVLAGRDKNVAAVAFEQAGASIPRSIPNLRSRKLLVAAGRELGFPMVLKHPRSAMGQGVSMARSASEAERIGERWGIARGRAPVEIGLLAQEALDLGKRDVRLHLARDVVTGKLRPVGATDRVALGDDFRANGGTDGNMIRPIYDLSGNDPALPKAMIDEAITGADAAGFDWVAVDMATVRSGPRAGEHVIIEMDNFAHPLEANHPVPVEQQTFPRAADLLIWGDRQAWNA